MKLYIKANNKKIIKNLDILLPKYNTKTASFLNNNSPVEYITNLESANIFEAEVNIFSPDSLTIVTALSAANATASLFIIAISDVITFPL